MVVLLLRSLGHHHLGGEQEAGDGCGVLERQARDLGRVQDAHLDHVAVLAGRGVVAVAALALADLGEHDRTVFTGVLHDLAQRLLDRPRQDADADVLVVVRTHQLIEHLLHANERDAATRHHALLDRRTGCVQRVLEAGLLFLHLDLGGRADLDHRDAAGELCDALLQLFLVVVGGGILDLPADVLDPAP